MNTLIILCFIIGYLFIAMESTTHINKSGVALLMSVVCWTLYILMPTADHSVFASHVNETCETILFLLGAMTIVEVLDQNGCFKFIIHRIHTRNLRLLLWVITLLTFILSAVLDNMTTSILMIMMLQKLVPQRSQRLLISGMVIIAANAGGAFSPIGDVTTIMLWINGNVSTFGILRSLTLPSLVSILVPILIITPMVKGEIEINEETILQQSEFSRFSRLVILLIGILGLISVPVFRSWTGLPPFVGIMGVLAILWITTEMMFRLRRNTAAVSDDLRVAHLIRHIDLPTILFFMGILLSVGALKEIGALSSMGSWLDYHIGNVYAINGIIGILSSIIDNVPLVAGSMSMYAIAPEGAAEALQIYQQDGIFWQLLAYCAGTGGSLLIIGSAAGVVVMGLEKITFGWYLRHFTLLALIGYLSGLACFYLSNIL